MFVPNTCFVLQATPPPRRTDRHLIIKSTASSFSTLLLLCFDLMEFPSFWFFLKLFFFPSEEGKKKKNGLTCSINNKKEFFSPHVSFCVLCYVEMFVSGEWIHMFLTPVTAPLLEALLTHNYSRIRINGTDGKILELFESSQTRLSPEQSENK